jgi:hypothetical protein
VISTVIVSQPIWAEIRNGQLAAVFLANENRHHLCVTDVENKNPVFRDMVQDKVDESRAGFRNVALSQTAAVLPPVFIVSVAFFALTPTATSPAGLLRLTALMLSCCNRWEQARFDEG